MFQSNEKMNLQIKHYISKGNAEYALLLTGKWGCGKTYYIENLIQETIDAKMVYYSLNGVTSISEIINSIFFELFCNEKIKKGITVGKKAGVAISELITDKSDFGKVVIKLGTVGANFFIDNYIRHFQNQEKVNPVIILDDLERMSSNIDITDLLGMVHTKFSLNGIKVIYIADEGEIKNNNQYDREKEKNIRRTISFSYDKRALYKSFLKDTGIYSDDFLIVLENVFCEEQENLRTIQFCLDCYIDLLESYENLPNKAEYNSPESLFYTVCQIGKFYKKGNTDKNKLEEALATYFYKSHLNNKEPDEYETFANYYGSKLIKQRFIYDLIFDGVFSDKDLTFFLKKPKNNDDPIYTLSRAAEMETSELKSILSQVEENIINKKYSIKQYFYFIDLFLPNIHKFTSDKDEYYYKLITDSVFAEENKVELEDTFLYWLKDPFSSIKEAKNSYEEKVLQAFNEFCIKNENKEFEDFLDNIKNCNKAVFDDYINHNNVYTLLISTNSIEQLLSFPNKSLRFFAYFVESTICQISNAFMFYSDQIVAIKNIIAIIENAKKRTTKDDIMRIESLTALKKVLETAVVHIQNKE